MEKALSPLILNLFTSKFETQLNRGNNYFPRGWQREDNIFAIFHKNKCSIELLRIVNTKLHTIEENS